MNATALSTEPNLAEANLRHDSTKHSVCMDWNCAYGKTTPTNRGCGFPPRPKEKRKRIHRSIDAHGNITVELK
jgi:hypothetical protein